VAFKTLKEELSSKLVGVGEDRIAIRTQGCWSCVHASYDKAKDLWWKEARNATLSQAVRIALASPEGENDRRVKNIRGMVPAMDAAFEKNQWVCCAVGKKPDGTPVDRFVAATYLCNVWTGATGASVAREGQKADKLPEELFEDFTNDGKTE
jgi:hypothetical protein